MSLKKNAFYSVILTVSNVLFPFITTPYISRVLGVENVGIVNFAMAYAAYFVIFAMLGIPTYGIRIIASSQASSRRERSKIFTELFTLITISSTVVSVIYIASIFLIPQLYEHKAFLLVVGLTVYLASFNIEWYFSGREQFKFITVRSLVVKLLMLGAMFVFVKNTGDVMAYLLLLVGSTLISHFWNWIYLLRDGLKRIRLSELNLAPHLKPLFLLLSASLAISIYTMLDTLMLGFLSTYTEVGYYTSAIKVSRLVLPIVTAMSPVVFARISILRQQGDMTQISRVLNNSFSYMFIMAVPITVGMIMISPRFVPMFFGTEFLPTILPMQLLSLLVLIVGISNVYGSQTVQAFGHDKKFLIAVLAGTAVNFALNLLFIKRYGAVGASIASITAEISVAIMMVYFANKIIKNRPALKTVIGPIVASLPIIAVSWWLDSMEVGDIVYFSILISVSILSYVTTMIFGFKNEILRSVMLNVLNKIKRH